MNKLEKLIRDYHALSPMDITMGIYNFHVKMQKKKGHAVQGHLVEGTHGIRDTAHDFNMSVGRVTQHLAIAKAFLKGDITERTISIKKQMVALNKELKRLKKERKQYERHSSS